MKKLLVVGFSFVAAMALLGSCNKGEVPVPTEPQSLDNLLDGAVPTGYYGYAEVSVPVGTNTVYISYNEGQKLIEYPVTPIMEAPKDGKDVEPFGRVKFLFTSEKPTRVSVYYKAGDIGALTKAGGEQIVDEAVLSDFMVGQITSGAFGQTCYVQVQWNFCYTDGQPNYPKDVVIYNKEHDHTLRYKFAYTGTNQGFAYFLDDIYTVEDYVVTAVKTHYCASCDGCPKCMPWGCSCGCGGENTNFTPSGNTTAGAAGPKTVVVDTTKPGETALTNDPAGPTVIVDNHGTIIAGYATTDVNAVNLPEPQAYVTKDSDQTFYHSSGVVMFDDRWPSINEKGYRYDFNDVVVDYDIEALTVADDQLESEGWREQVKVVLHVRALGGNDGNRVGVVLENFNTDNVSYVDEFYTLDSWQNAHGDLPTWTETTLVENSLRYDGLTAGIGRSAWGEGTKLRPAFEIGRLQALNDKDGKSTGGKTSGNEVYQYKGKDHVFNPGRRQYPAWQSPDADQYSADLDALYQSVSGRTLANAQSMQLYNTIPGFVNVAGGLYTYTVIYHMKDRAEMTPEESAACKANMMETVVNTTNQNFFLVKGDYGAVGLKGYQPLDCAVKDFNKGYKSKYDEIVAAHAEDLDLTTTYKAKNGMVWGFKCPTLTRHAWELIPFSTAYPHYEEWVKSNGQSHKDWYYDADVNTTALVCEW